MQDNSSGYANPRTPGGALGWVVGQAAARALIAQGRDVKARVANGDSWEIAAIKTCAIHVVKASPAFGIFAAQWAMFDAVRNGRALGIREVLSAAHPYFTAPKTEEEGELIRHTTEMSVEIGEKNNATICNVTTRLLLGT